MPDPKERAFQSYLDNIQAKTGRTPDDFIAEAAERGLTQSREILVWLATDYGLGLGHARAIDYAIRHGAEFSFRSSAEPGVNHPGTLILDGSSLPKRTGRG
jgi:hypothetical protein